MNKKEIGELNGFAVKVCVGQGLFFCDGGSVLRIKILRPEERRRTDVSL